MSWLKAHLNLTYTIALIIVTILYFLTFMLHSDSLAVIGGIIYIVSAGWVLTQKAQPLWWLLLMLIFSVILFSAPLWLANVREWREAEKQYKAEHKSDKQ